MSSPPVDRLLCRLLDSVNPEISILLQCRQNPPNPGDPRLTLHHWIRSNLLGALDIVPHRLGLGLDPVHPCLDEIANRDQPHHQAAFNDRQVADTPSRHQG